MITTDEFIARELAATDKRVFTVEEVIEMADRLREERIAAAEPFEGYITDSGLRHQEASNACYNMNKETPSSATNTLGMTPQLEVVMPNQHTTSAPLAERFWSKVDKSGDCWLWTGTIHDTGYGRFPLRSGDRYIQVFAHRLSFELTNGPISDGLHVLHHCDNRPCVRPDHLFLGTNYDNIMDAFSKDRPGTPFVKSPLTEDLVREIRARHDRGEAVCAIARDLDVGVSAVRRAALRLSWRHVPEMSSEEASHIGLQASVLDKVVTVNGFIQPKHKHLNLLVPQPYGLIHLVKNGLPYCQGDVFNLGKWEQSNVTTLVVNICGRCRRRTESGIEMQETEARPRPLADAPTAREVITQ